MDDTPDTSHAYDVGVKHGRFVRTLRDNIVKAGIVIVGAAALAVVTVKVLQTETPDTDQ